MTRFSRGITATIGPLWIPTVLTATATILGLMIATLEIKQEAEPLMSLHAEKSQYSDSVATAVVPPSPPSSKSKLISSSSENFMQSSVDAAFQRGSCDYADQVMQDEPRVYWRFSSATENGGIIEDTISTGGNAMAKEGVLFGMPSAIGCTNDYSLGFLWPREAYVSAKVVGRSFQMMESDAFTAELWARPMALTGYRHQTVLSTWDNPKNPLQGFTIRIIESESTGTWSVSCGSSDGNGVVTIKGRPVNLGEWFHLVFSSDGDRIRFVVNEQSIDSHARCKFSPQGSTLFIGASGPTGPFFQGDIDEVALYDVPLPWKRVQSHLRAAGLLDGPVEDQKMSRGERIGNRRRRPNDNGFITNNTPRRD